MKKWLRKEWKSKLSRALLLVGSISVISVLWIAPMWDGKADLAKASLSSSSYTVAASDAPLEWRNEADWVCDGDDDQIEIQAANDACAGGGVELSLGNFNIEEDLVINNCTLVGQGPGGPGSTYATRLNLSDGKTIVIQRYLVGAGRLKNVLIYCPSGFTGEALEIAAGVGDVKGLLEDARVYCDSYDNSGTPTGRGLWLHAEATTNNRYVTNNSCFGVSVEGFEYGVVLTAENSATNDGWVNANIFFDLNITNCKNSLVLDNAGTNPGAVRGNIFLPVTIESYNGAVNGIHLASTVQTNQITLSEWSAPSYYSGSLILCDAGTAFNVIEGHFDETGVTDNAINNRIERLTKREAGVRVYNSGHILINNAQTTTLTFDSERYDTDGIHSTTTNTGRLTCKTPGTYLIKGQVRFDGHATGKRLTYIFLNNTAILVNTSENNLDDEAVLVFVSTICQLAYNDYVELRVHQTSGGPLYVKAAAQVSPEFMMQRIGY